MNGEEGGRSRRRSAELMAAGVAYTTIVIGTAALIAPERLGALGGVRDDRGFRVIGVVDLAIAAGIMFSPRRSRWLRARAAANPPTALFLWRLGQRADRRAPGAIGLMITALSLQDLAAARELARGE